MSTERPQQITNLIESLRSTVSISHELYRTFQKWHGYWFTNPITDLLNDDDKCTESDFQTRVKLFERLMLSLEESNAYAIGCGRLMKFGLPNAGIYETDLRNLLHEIAACLHPDTKQSAGILDAKTDLLEQQLAKLQSVAFDYPDRNADALSNQSESRNTTASGESLHSDPFARIGWFHPKLQDRIRKATNPERKTMRVRRRLEEGTWVYSVNDARRWWPEDVKEYPGT